MTKPFLYPLKNAIYDTSLECRLVRTLRHRYNHRHETKHWNCGLKYVYESIRELRTFRNNRETDPERHARLDKAYMEARKANFLMHQSTPNYQHYERIKDDCRYQLTQRKWNSGQIEIPHFENGDQLALFDVA